MEPARARSLLEAERAEAQSLLAQLATTGEGDREAGRETGDEVDSADPLAAEGVDDAVVAGLQDRLAAIERAEKRLAEGTFGVSIRSGTPIPDERLEVMPTAELTVEEASD
ncbi:MAG: TraR/DksA family transcriptional regulator [Nocardioidaceae bacterium]